MTATAGTTAAGPATGLTAATTATAPPARGRVRTAPSPKRVRAYLGGHLVVDSTRAVLVWEVPYYPQYYIPAADVVATLTPTGGTEHSPSRGDAERLTVSIGDAQVIDGAIRIPESPIDVLRELVRLNFDAMDAWFEEDEEIFVHPRDPFTRVDILPSSRQIRVELEGVVLAESDRARLLFETGLPTRYYLPRTDVHLELMEPTERRTGCPYKGWAEYWSVRLPDRTVPDLVWSYPTPFPESQKVAGLMAFYNEKLDIFVNGELQDRPHTKFS